MIDFHTHTFPEKIAAAALSKLQAASHTRAFTDGTNDGLTASMARRALNTASCCPWRPIR